MNGWNNALRRNEARIVAVHSFVVALVFRVHLVFFPLEKLTMHGNKLISIKGTCLLTSDFLYLLYA